MQQVVIYSNRACPFCINALRALDRARIRYEKIEVQLTAKVRAELAARTGEPTVPQIFVDGEYIGQDDEVIAMIHSGALSAA